VKAGGWRLEAGGWTGVCMCAGLVHS
jgi:hypothetical protein